MKQMSFADMEISRSRKASRISKKLDKINRIVNWEEILKIVQVVDRTSKEKGGAPHKDLLMKVKMVFLQHLYNLSDPELEDQVNDRISFQRFVGADFTTTIPDFTTIWRFKERLISEGINDILFSKILAFIESKNLLLKKGTIVDATIIQSSGRPLSKKKRKKLKENPSSQIDTDASATKKRKKWYFGYKGHIGTDVGSKLIRKRKFSTASHHDSRYTESLLSGDELAILGDSAYGNNEDKKKCRADGIFYGMLDKGTRRRALSNAQKKQNQKKSRVRSAVEHPFAFMKEKSKYKLAVAKTESRNRFRFDMNCILYNIFRASFLLGK